MCKSILKVVSFNGINLSGKKKCIIEAVGQTSITKLKVTRKKFVN